MGWRQKGLGLWVLCAVVVLLAIHGSRGSVSYFRQHFSKPSSRRPFARRTLLLMTSASPPLSINTEFQSSSMLAPSPLPPHEGPSIEFDVPPSAEISSTLPHVKDRAPSPAHLTKSQRPVVPPTSITSPSIHRDKYHMPAVAPPKDLPSHLSPVNYLHPKASAVSPIATSSPATHHSWYGTPVAAPSKELSSHLSPASHLHQEEPAISPASIDSPATHEIRHGVPAAAPSGKVSNNPTLLNYSKGPFVSPKVATPPAVNYAHPNGSAVSPAANAPPAIHGNKYVTPVASPPKEVSSHSAPLNISHTNGSAISPTATTSPSVHGNKYGTPVAAPPEEISSHSSSLNYSRPNGPTISPTPTTSPAIHGIKYGTPVAAPPKEESSHPDPQNNSHPNGPAVSPSSTASHSVHGNKHGIPVAAPPKEVSIHSGSAESPMATTSPAINGNTYGTPVAAPPKEVSRHTAPLNNQHSNGPAVSPTSITSPAIHGNRYGMPVAAPRNDISSHISPVNSSHRKGSYPVISPAPHVAEMPASAKHAPFNSHPHHPVRRIIHSPVPAPAVSFHHWEPRKKIGSPASVPSHQFPSKPYHPAPSYPPAELPKNSQSRHASPPYVQGPSISPAPYLADSEGAPAPSVSTVVQPAQPPVQSPLPSPPGATPGKLMPPLPQPVRALPPPPPNLDCTPLPCAEPLTNTPPGTPCSCVLPIKVELRLSVALYTFFPLVSELAHEIASGVFMEQSQVRVMGANATSEEPEKTIVLLYLVPLGENFDHTKAYLVYDKFWHKQVFINPSLFGDYDVLYVIYPGLPFSPPTPGNINADDGTFGSYNNSGTLHPLGVDVRKRKERPSGTTIAVLVLSAVIVLVLFIGAAWVLILKNRYHSLLLAPSLQVLQPSVPKNSGTGTGLCVSMPSSASVSFSSSITTCTGSAKTFSLAEMERATNKFNNSRIIGEGGFGRVYAGTLDDGTKVAVKVLKRDDQQGSREFLAEVEMLGRLHHRNLVRLIGICTEEHIRCLVYELVPNGSVESHLYGRDKETAPLDWNARLKVALGAARGLAYLHEDSSPRVIHRDFKSSNILLEQDFTPKVSDFGLARTALDEGNRHISTRVMGTFGYVAPEYAMTGHLLVKSDVYSYGVVLLELLTGRKPVDMLRPPGQENLVTWARPLLTSKDGLETIIDPSLGTGSGILFDSVAKVAAIASMCVQPEVDQRPFMGEVVQALKLVCNEGDENRGSGSCSQEELSSQDMEVGISAGLDESERGLSASDICSASARFTRDASGSFRRYSGSGPLRPGRNEQFSHRVRGSTGSASEHGDAPRIRRD